jgi:hypothetical protein
MNNVRSFSAVLIFPIALLATACLHGSSKPKAAPQEVRLEGEITKGEFGCYQVKTADGERYSLARDLEGSKVGQKVWVEGYMVKTKGCMPGKSVMPKRAGLLQGAVATEAAETVPAAGSGHH